MWKYLLIEVNWSLKIEKHIRTMASIKRNHFHQKERTGGGVGSSDKRAAAAKKFSLSLTN